MDSNDYLHGCNVLYWLVKPWANTDSVVVADSYFASVPAAIRLKEAGLRFIGVVKTATKEYPMQYLGSVELHGGKGSRKGLTTTDEATGTQLLSFVWVERDRHYFISTASSLEEGAVIARQRWTQVDRSENAEAELIDRHIPQPKAAETYYKGASKIDQHIRHRQDSLNIEKKLQTNDWSKRVNQTIVSMCIVDAYLLTRGCGTTPLTGQAYFLEKLAEELIDNDYDVRTLCRSHKRSCEVVD